MNERRRVFREFETSAVGQSVLQVCQHYTTDPDILSGNDVLKSPEEVKQEGHDWYFDVARDGQSAMVYNARTGAFVVLITFLEGATIFGGYAPK